MMDQINNLILQKEFGINETIASTAINRMNVAESCKNSNNVSAMSLSRNNNIVELANISGINSANVIDISAVSKSKAIAEKCNSLEELKESILNLEDISIKKTAMNTVFADGNANANIMFIGEAPGAEEDKQGIAFCGSSGKLLDKSLSYIGLDRKKNFYIANTIFWRPPGNRRPTNEELDICRPFVEKHIALLQPKLVILVGGTAVSSLLGESKKITKIRGQYCKYSNKYLEKELTITSVFHPSYLLRQPSQKRLFWQDLLSIREFLTDNRLT